MKNKVAIALGGNIGNMHHTFARVFEKLAAVLDEISMAGIIVTKAENCVPDTPDFHNTVVTGYYSGSPEELLNFCQSIEVEMGRPASHSSRESRTVDLDVLLWNSDVVHNPPLLIIPHPRMKQRRFVLQPLAEIAPDWIVPPEGKTVAQLLGML